MNQLLDIIRFSTFGYLLLINIQLLRSKMKRSQVLPAIGFCSGVMSYLIVEFPPLTDSWLFYILLGPAFVTPLFFWLISKSLFDDKFQIRKRLLWVILFVEVYSYLIFFENKLGWLSLKADVRTALGIGQQTISLFFVILAILEATRNKDADLIIQRLKFRNVFILLTASLMVLTILSEIEFRQSEAPLSLELLQKVVIFGLALYFAIHRLNLKPGFFDEKKEELNTSFQKTEIDSYLITQLLELIDGEKYYRQDGLTIRHLAEKLQVKEYRLRRSINHHLGFRNFNDFLNSYRIAEACDLLSDPANKELTILEISFHLGFNSLAPFNKTFKQATGKTPTEWRRTNLPIG